MTTTEMALSPFQEVVARLGVKVPAPDWFRLELLVELPPTDQVVAARNRKAERLNATRSAMADGLLPANAGRNLVLAAERELARAERTVNQARRRDELAASRPVGCWCLGMGGRGSAALATCPEDEDRTTFAEYCGCADGQAARSSAADRVARGKAEIQARRLARVWGGSGVPDRYRDASLESWADQVALRGGDPFAYLAMFRDWLPTDRWLVLFGPVGRGKTGLAIALLRELVVRSGRSALFATVPELLDRIRSTYGRRSREDEAPSEQDLMEQLLRVDILVLDDLGTERTTDWVAERLFTVLNRRQAERRRTLITTNLPVPEMSRRLGERVMSRLLEDADVVQLDGPNLREVAA